MPVGSVLEARVESVPSWAPKTTPIAHRPKGPPLRKLPTMIGEPNLLTLILLIVAVVVAVVVILKLRNVFRRRTGDLPETRFGDPAIVKVLYAFSVLLVSLALVKAPDILVGVVVAAVFALPALLGLFISYFYEKGQQRLRDERATMVLSKVKEGEKCEYSLFLRAFVTTGKMPQVLPRSHFEFLGGVKAYDNMEYLVARATEHTAPLIALGNTDEEMRAGRIAASEENWKGIFDLLAPHAKVLLLLPSETQGTQDEIDWIRDRQLWNKVILLMPREDRSYKWAELWESMRPNLKKIGLDLPQYRKCGMVFWVNERGQLKLFQPQGKKEIGQIVAELTDGVGLKPDSYINLSQTLDLQPPP